MVALHRHQLVRLRAEAWMRLQHEASDAQRLAAVRCWGDGGFPLVVSRQPCRAPLDGAVAVGLAAPAALQRCRWSFTVQRDEVLYFDEFPLAADITPLLHRRVRGHWAALCAGLARIGVRGRVYGSHGWQHLTGLSYLRPGSDLDLCLPVQDAEEADRVVQWLTDADPSLPRLDGELLFPDGAGVAWREWQAWRGGRVREVLVKRLHGVELTAQPACEAMA